MFTFLSKANSAKVFLLSIAMAFFTTTEPSADLLEKQTYYCDVNGTCNKDWKVETHNTAFELFAYCGVEGGQTTVPTVLKCSSPNAYIACDATPSGSAPTKGCVCNKKQQKTKYEVKAEITCYSQN